MFYLIGNRKSLNVFKAENGINLVILRETQFGCDAEDRLQGEKDERQED